MTDVDPRTHPELLEVLDRARALGFTGPGDPLEHIDHALRFVELAKGFIPPPHDAISAGSPLSEPGVGAGLATGLATGPDVRPEEDTDEVRSPDLVVGQRRSATGIDLGTGGGVPGLVLAITLPWINWLLVDSMHRRSVILQEAVLRLGLEQTVTVWCGRAENLGRDPEVRHTVDLVVARSFGPPSVTAECAAPLLRVGGRLLVSEPPESSGERWKHSQLGDLGLEPISVDQGVMVLGKKFATPEQYPRRVGIPAKRPLF